MEITLKMYLIVIPLTFLAGFVDAIGGGGGLISLPAYMLAGLPTHYAIASNKLTGVGGTSISLARFIKQGYVVLKLAIPCVIAAVIGSATGARMNLLVSERVLAVAMIIILPIMMLIVFNKKLFPDREDETVVLNRRTYLTGALSALVVGVYDGFYGPGAGTLWIIAFSVFAKLGIKTSNAHAKVINFTTSATSLLVYMLSGNVLFKLAFPSMLANMAGSYLGTGLAIKNGSRITKPVIVIVLVLLGVKIVTENFL
ncbi:MAG: TSUP family transporter [Lachnospiraceae bacterium]|nr:TSUP family transporter [Lachnospiraceae bacterium]